jgi:hypothetical protein
MWDANCVLNVFMSGQADQAVTISDRGGSSVRVTWHGFTSRVRAKQPRRRAGPTPEQSRDRLDAIDERADLFADGARGAREARLTKMC